MRAGHVTNIKISSVTFAVLMILSSISLESTVSLGYGVLDDPYDWILPDSVVSGLEVCGQLAHWQHSLTYFT
eukprot:m.36233 g.36233  ORF g.36233 m.36233 type:complete len:72 (+) comp14467_c0_seq2:1627-1842(+)